MTSPKPMTREELLELAALDAFGLLDEYEAALYTRSFHEASAGVQDEIITLQASLASDESLLPDEMPPAELRTRVIDAVGRAIEEDSPDLSPIATIGRPNRGDALGSNNRFKLDFAGQMWRAAAFVLAASVVVVAYFWADAYRSGIEIARKALDNNTSGQIETMIGPTFKDFIFDPSVTPIHLAAVDPASGFCATLYVSEDNRIFIVSDKLPKNGEDEAYTLRVVDAGGKTTDLVRFDSSGGLSGHRMDDAPRFAALTNVTWQILDTAGAVILTSRA